MKRFCVAAGLIGLISLFDLGRSASAQEKYHDPGLKKVIQVAIVVRDIEAASKRWSEVLGMPVPEIRTTRPGNEVKMTYRGKPSEGQVKLTFFNLGQVVLELLQPVGEGTSWKEILDKKGEGVHHLGFQVVDPESLDVFTHAPEILSAFRFRFGIIWSQKHDSMNDSTKLMGKSCELTRRGFVKSCALGFVMAGAGSLPVLRAASVPTPAQQLPLKLGIRAASMRMVGDIGVIQTAAGIPGIRGVELQVTAGARNLRDWDTVRQYKRESDRWDIRIPSLAGVWDKGIKISSPDAGESLQLSIRAAEMLGSSVILVAFFKQDAPDMNREDSYSPVVTNLQKAAVAAADAGVVLGLENSLSPADNRKLVDLVGHPAVSVYYDLHNMDTYGHGAEAIPGVKLLGRERICAVHVKNGAELIERPGPIDWPAAFTAYNEIGYDGWYTYETQHKSVADCIADTPRNNAFLAKHIRMPMIPK